MDDSSLASMKKSKKEKHLLPGNWYILVCIVGMIMAFVWTYCVSGILLDLLGFLGVISKLSSTYLALTIIAVGNAFPDAMLTIALAKKGDAKLGITGGYAGQLFGLLVGFGLAQLKNSLTSDEKIVFVLFQKDNILDIVCIFTALLSLTVTLVYGIMNQ